MTKTPILKQTFYTDLFRYIFIKGEARSYEITKKFNPIKKRGKCIEQKQIKNNKINFSMKLQNLKNLGFVKVIKKGSRGRHGKYSVYTINYEGIIEFIIKHYLKEEKIRSCLKSSSELEGFIKTYLSILLGRKTELKSLNYYFDYILTLIGFYPNKFSILLLNNPLNYYNNQIFIDSCKLYVEKKLFKERFEENLL